MCLAQGPQRSDAGEARTRGPSVYSQALYHRATALPHENCLSCNIIPYFCRKLGKMLQNLWSAAVVLALLGLTLYLLMSSIKTFANSRDELTEVTHLIEHCDMEN